MQAAIFKTFYKTINDFDIVFSLINDHHLKIEAMSKQNDVIFTKQIKDEVMPPQCKVIFDNCIFLYQYIQENAIKPDLVFISQSKNFNIVLPVNVGKKTINQKCQFQLQKVQNTKQKNKIMHNLITQMKQYVLIQQTSKQKQLQIKNLSKRREQLKIQLQNLIKLGGIKLNSHSKMCAPIISDIYGQKIYITVRDDNPFLNNYSYQDNTLIKTKQKSTWINLLCNQQIPKKGKYYFTFKIMMSLYNNIEVGIVMKQYQPQVNSMTQKAISYHFMNGRMRPGYDNKVNKIYGKPVQKLWKGVITNVIDNEKSQMLWYANGQFLGKIPLTQNLKIQKIVPFIGMCHVDDIIQLNSQIEK